MVKKDLGAQQYTTLERKKNLEITFMEITFMVS